MYQALDLVQTVVHPTAGHMRLVGAGVTLEGHDETSIAPGPLLGEHGEAILRELSYSDEAIAGLRASEVI